jgi:hypothetical protein
VRPDDQPARLVDDEPETGDAIEPPGAVDRDINSYTGEKP